MKFTGGDLYIGDKGPFKASLTIKPKRHDHRQSMWLIAGGGIMWCYQCGAYRPNFRGTKWQKPTGLGGPNPAMKP